MMRCTHLNCTIREWYTDSPITHYFSEGNYIDSVQGVPEHIRGAEVHCEDCGLHTFYYFYNYPKWLKKYLETMTN